MRDPPADAISIFDNRSLANPRKRWREPVFAPPSGEVVNRVGYCVTVGVTIVGVMLIVPPVSPLNCLPQFAHL